METCLLVDGHCENISSGGGRGIVETYSLVEGHCGNMSSTGEAFWQYVP